MDINLNIDNESLIKECVNGNKVALNHFYTRFAPKMLSVILRYVNNPMDAEDILHDGFIVAYTRLESIRDPERVEYWLASIMKNLSLQFLQAQDVVTLLHEMPEIEDTPEFGDIIDLPTLESLIKKLPPGYQKVFRLSVLDNKSHKEIAKILGIAHSTSSSQLFHAKMMMRKLIYEHRREAGMLTLLLVVIAVGLIWITGNDNLRDDVKQEKITLPVAAGMAEAIIDATDIGNTSETSGTNIDECKLPQVFKEQIRMEAESAEELPDSCESEKKPHMEILAPRETDNCYATDKTTADKTVRDLQGNDYSVAECIPAESGRPGDWSFKVGVGLGMWDLDGNVLHGKETGSPVGGTTERPDDEQALRGEDCAYRNVAHHSDLPVTVSVTANKSISRVLGIETGLTYTFLRTTFESENARSNCGWHYLGIPIKLTVNNFSSRRFKFYAAAGVQLDIPLSSSAASSSTEVSSSIPDGKFKSSAVWSLSVSYGVSFNITDYVGIFMEPSLQYHFKHHYEVPNVWNDNPISFSLPIGVRFSF